jgi:DNA-binding PadR family transcriptional regulator
MKDMKDKDSKRMMFSVPRGFMEMHILSILENPHYGYEIIKHIEQECVYWKPSPGSVYPMLQKLKKGGLITKKSIGKKNVYTITKSGRKRIKKFDLYKDEVKDKMIAIFKLMGEHNVCYIEKSFDVFEKIKRDPVKLKKAAGLRKKFIEELEALERE